LQPAANKNRNSVPTLSRAPQSHGCHSRNATTAGCRHQRSRVADGVGDGAECWSVWACGWGEVVLVDVGVRVGARRPGNGRGARTIRCARIGWVEVGVSLGVAVGSAKIPVWGVSSAVFGYSSSMAEHPVAAFAQHKLVVAHAGIGYAPGGKRRQALPAQRGRQAGENPPIAGWDPRSPAARLARKPPDRRTVGQPGPRASFSGGRPGCHPGSAPQVDAPVSLSAKILSHDQQPSGVS